MIPVGRCSAVARPSEPGPLGGSPWHSGSAPSGGRLQSSTAYAFPVSASRSAMVADISLTSFLEML